MVKVAFTVLLLLTIVNVASPAPGGCSLQDKCKAAKELVDTGCSCAIKIFETISKCVDITAEIKKKWQEKVAACNSGNSAKTAFYVKTYPQKLVFVGLMGVLTYAF